LDQRNWDSSCGQRARLVYRWVQDEGGDWGSKLWAICGKKAHFSLGMYATVFQAEMYANLACAHEIQFQGRPEKHMSICSDSQAAFKTLQTIGMSPLVQQCQ